MSSYYCVSSYHGNCLRMLSNRYFDVYIYAKKKNLFMCFCICKVMDTYFILRELERLTTNPDNKMKRKNIPKE